MSQTFKEFLLTEAAKKKPTKKKAAKKKAAKKKAATKGKKKDGDEVEKVKLFSAKELTQSMRPVIKSLHDLGGTPSDNWFNSLLLIEAITIVKEALASKLEPYLTPGYKTYQKDDKDQVLNSITKEISEVLHLAFLGPDDGESDPQKYIPATKLFIRTIVAPILEKVDKLGLEVTANSIDMSSLDSTADDSFGDLITLVMSSKSGVYDQQDAAVARKLLYNWGQKVRARARKIGSNNKVKRRTRNDAMNDAIATIISKESVKTDEKDNDE